MKTGRLWFDSQGRLIVRRQYAKQFVYTVHIDNKSLHTTDCQGGTVLTCLQYMTLAPSLDMPDYLVGVISLSKAKHVSEVRRKLCCIAHVEALDRHNFQVVKGTKQDFIYKAPDSGFGDEVKSVKQILVKKFDDPVTVPVKIESETEL